jgi:hypothetical protein
VRVSVKAIDVRKLVLTNEGIMRRLGEAQLEAGGTRASSGDESDGAPAPAYAKSTVKKRARLGLQTGTRDLIQTGEMMATRTITAVDDRSVTIGWPGDWSAAAYFTDQRTPWILPTFDEAQALRAQAAELIKSNCAAAMDAVRAEGAT